MIQTSTHAGSLEACYEEAQAEQEALPVLASHHECRLPFGVCVVDTVLFRPLWPLCHNGRFEDELNKLEVAASCIQ